MIKWHKSTEQLPDRRKMVLCRIDTKENKDTKLTNLFFSGVCTQDDFFGIKSVSYPLSLSHNNCEDSASGIGFRFLSEDTKDDALVIIEWAYLTDFFDQQDWKHE